MKNILFIAPPAGGKGTESELLQEQFGYIHISTGDLLREVDPESELGREVNSLIQNGKFVSDEIVLSLLKNKMESIKDNEAFILDGYPRNIEQAHSLETLLSELHKNLDLAIEIDVPYDILLRRAIGRENCPNCKSTYNIYFKPSKEEGRCDKCGHELVHRSDDNEETFKTRYETYLTTTAPIIDFYREKGKLVKVDGINNTHETIVSVIKND